MNVAESTYFLDTSALVKLYHQEQGSDIVESYVADQNNQIWISILTRVEFHSVFVRKFREEELTEITLQTVFESFHEDLHHRFQVLSLTEDIIEKAILLFLSQGKTYPLRTLDALQIASAQTVEHHEVIFVTADRKQFTVANRLFSRVINPEINVEYRSQKFE